MGQVLLQSKSKMGHSVQVEDGQEDEEYYEDLLDADVEYLDMRSDDYTEEEDGDEDGEMDSEVGEEDDGLDAGDTEDAADDEAADGEEDEEEEGEEEDEMENEESTSANMAALQEEADRAGKGKKTKRRGKGVTTPPPDQNEDANPSDSSASDSEEIPPSHNTDSGEKVTVGCDAENALREAIKVSRDHTGRMGPMILRSVFHDSIDANNLMLMNKETSKWEPISGTGDGEYGGVDGCLYSPLDKGSHGVPEPSHNRNLPSSFGWAEVLCNQYCGGKNGKKDGICRSRPACIVDVTVLGSLVAVEAVGGPHIPMVWGRRKGSCEKLIETPFSKDPKQLASYINKPALGFAPSLTGIDDGQSFRDAFERLGFNPSDQAALMGAHTFGKLQVCAGGLNGIEGGPFCNKPSEIDPPLTDANLYPNCYPKIGVVSHCWVEVKSKKTLVPMYATSGKIHKHNATKNGFGDGGFFDRTPTKFDNDYFKLFAEEEYEGKDICCGKTKGGGCHRGGRGMPLERVTKRKADGFALASEKAGGSCDFNWCRSDRKGRTHMKSIKSWHEAPHDFVKKGYHHGVTKRMIRLAGDWALLANDDTKAAVKQFAANQDDFFAAFKVAWGKVITKGHSGLKACDSADKYAPKVHLKPPNAHIKDAPFQSDGKGTGCRDTHRKCHLFADPKKNKKICRKKIWAARCPFTCKTC